MGAQTLQLGLQQNSPWLHIFWPQGTTEETRTQAQTLGELSQTRSGGHPISGILHTHRPPQSAPPRAGSQLSVGSSSQVPAPGQRRPAKPPQLT